MNRIIRKALSLKSFILGTTLLASAFSLAQGALVRPYNPNKDYKATHNLCLQHWKAFEENPSCTGLFDFMVQVLSPSHSFHNDPKMRTIKGRVLEDKKVIGIQISIYPITATKEFVARGILADDSYAELAYIGIDKNHQGKGYGSQLFNSCKEELLENKNLKAILSRISYFNTAAMDWHRKQGFVELTLENANTEFEKSYLREAAGYAQKVFRLEVPKSAPDDAPVLTDKQKVLVTLVAQKAIEQGSILTNEEIRYAIETYVQTPNRVKAYDNFVAHALTKRIAPSKLHKVLNTLFDYMDEALEHHSETVDDSIRTAKTTI